MRMSGVEKLEAARLRLQEELDAAKSAAERNRLGQFATPPGLARDVVAAAVSLLPDGSTIQFLDPAFGTGSFYSALSGLVPSSRIESAQGFEVDPHYGDAAKMLWAGTGLRLHLVDFTRAAPPEKDLERFNLVVCNPPYVRHHHLNEGEKRHLQAAVADRTGIALNGLSGLYCYFLALSRAWMAAGGVGAWLVPSEFMDVNYGAQLKRFLLENVSLLRIHRFDPDDVQFADALVSSAVVFFRNTPPSDVQTVEFSFGGSLAEPKVSESLAAEDSRGASKWTSWPRRSVRPERPTGGTLADLFHIKRGLATGCNRFFILSPAQCAEYEIPRAFLKPILPSPRDLDGDEIPADENGDPDIAQRRFLLDCRLPWDDVRAEHPALWAYLRRGIEAGVDRRYLCRHREPWYSQENRPPAPFLCTYMGRPTRKSAVPFRFLLNRSQATAANVYLLLYPKPWLAAVLKEDPGRQRAVRQALASLAAALLAGEGRIYGGGLYKLEPKELANVPAEAVLSVLPKECRQHRQQALFGT